MILAGIYISGTKCAVSLGKLERPDIRLIARKSLATSGTPMDVIQTFIHTLDDMMKEHTIVSLASIGISCGGPRGLIEIKNRRHFNSECWNCNDYR